MSNDNFQILGKTIKKGEGAILELEVAKLHTRDSLKITLNIERAEIDGPTLLLMSGVHGDELSGVAIIRDIIKKKYNKPFRGTIICMPVFNVFGYLNLTREFPDGRDLNRVFPGSSKGSLASQFAHRFTTEIAPYVDYVVDFHAGGAERENFPNIRCVTKQKEQLELAKVFGAPFIVDSGYIAKSIRATLNKLGKIVILFEGGKSKSLDETVISCGIEGALNIMKYLGLREGEIALNGTPTIIKKSRWIRAPYSGMFQHEQINGTKVRKRSMLGRISDPYGEFEKIIFAPYDCYLYGINTAPIVHKGDALFHVGIETQ